MSARARGWCLTGQYNEDNHKEELTSRLLREPYEYVCYGEEIAPTTGQKHLQGYIKYKNARTFNSIRKHLEGFHVIKATADAYSNKLYCSKTRPEDESPNQVFMEFGKVPSKVGEEGGKAEKRRWELAFESAKSGDYEEIPAELRIKYYSTFKKIATDYMINPEEIDGVCGEWYYGVSRTGKSYSARKDYPDAYPKLCNKWWDGYQGQDYVLIDDFDKKHDGLCHHLKIWADRYPFLAEVKGSTVSIRPKKIIITSNYHPREIWTSDGDLNPILERFRVTRFALPGGFNRGTMEPIPRVVDFNFPVPRPVVPAPIQVPETQLSPPYVPPISMDEGESFSNDLSMLFQLDM